MLVENYPKCFPMFIIKNLFDTFKVIHFFVGVLGKIRARVNDNRNIFLVALRTDYVDFCSVKCRMTYKTQMLIMKYVSTVAFR